MLKSYDNSGLLNTINKVISNKGSVLVIPPSKMNIADYNVLLKQLKKLIFILDVKIY